MIPEMAQNGRRFAVNFRNLISNAIRLMKLSIIGFLMMVNSILTISYRSFDRKWFKMAAVLVYNTGDIISSTIRSMKLGIVGLLMMPNTILTTPDR